MPRLSQGPKFAKVIDGVLEKIVAAAIIWGATRANGVIQSISELKDEVAKLAQSRTAQIEHDRIQDDRLGEIELRLPPLPGPRIDKRR